MPNEKTFHHYNKRLRHYANENRHGMTKSAARMWKYVLRNRMMRGYQFRRERPVLHYIADFACLPLKLVIEVDGITHHDQRQIAYDRRRDALLAEIGFTTLRFDSLEVFRDIGGVREKIGQWIDENAKVPPPPPRKRGRRR